MFAYYYTGLNIIGVRDGECVVLRTLDGKLVEANKLNRQRLVGVVRRLDLQHVLPLEQLAAGDRLKFARDAAPHIGIVTDVVTHVERVVETVSQPPPPLDCVPSSRAPTLPPPAPPLLLSVVVAHRQGR